MYPPQKIVVWKLLWLDLTHCSFGQLKREWSRYDSLWSGKDTGKSGN